MGSGASIPADTKVVIVGAGYAGAKLGTELMKHNVNFTVINSRDCFHHNVAGLRSGIVKGMF